MDQPEPLQLLQNSSGVGTGSISMPAKAPKMLRSGPPPPLNAPSASSSSAEMEA
jgi:hypothetical protein